MYVQVSRHQFLSYDDDTYVTNNAHVASGITVQNIVWAFTSIEANNWHPITWLSHMADVQFFGMDPRGHHLTNIAIHTVSVLLLFLLFLRLTGALWQCLFVAALFAIHPLHVESVAWVAERKDVLSTLFWFLTLIFYTEYVAKQKIFLYILTLLSLLLGLMSKPMLVTLPIIMLMLDYWPLGRYRYEKQKPDLRQCSDVAISLITEKIPFFVCALFSGLITIYAQSATGAMSNLITVPFKLRIENALVAYITYIGKTLWPRDLAVLYPLQQVIPLWQVVSSLFVLIFLSTAVIWIGRCHPYLLFGWFWFLITLLPVIGIIQVGVQSMADRYTYIPVTGLFIMVAWGVPDLTRRLRYRQSILALLAGVIIITSIILTWQQLGYWRDSISLYQHTLQVTTGNHYIHNNLGVALQAKGRLDEAIRELQEAVRISPNISQLHTSLGTAYAGKWNHDAAIQEYRQALLLDPGNKTAHNNLGVLFARRGDLDAAIMEYREALRINPGSTEVQINLDLVLAKKRMLDAINSPSN